MDKNVPETEISLDLLENLRCWIQIWHWHLKIFGRKFKQLGAKIKISTDSLENKFTSQFEATEYESDISIIHFFTGFKLPF